MRKIKPAVAVALVVLVLFGAGGILASVTAMYQRAGQDSAATANAGLFLLLAASGVALASAITVAFSHWHRRRQKH